MTRFFSRVYNMSPRDLVRRLRKSRRPNRYSFNAAKARDASQVLRELFHYYQTSNLRSIRPEEFHNIINSKIGTVDAQFEGYSEHELVRQRDLSVKFHWGHDHDFGSFKLQGRMGERHISVLANFVSLFPVRLEDFKDKTVFDVGCWTGGTTLIFASLGSNVLAVEEVRKYADTAAFLSKSFGLEDRITIERASLYECNSEEFYDRFDIVFLAGVIYHLSDPLLALRILFNSLRVGGIVLVESAGLNREEPLCEFAGSLVHGLGTEERLSRGGWNWFIPSPSALSRMMQEAGFSNVQSLWHELTGRVYAYGKKDAQVGICRAGLSVPSIK